MDLDPEIVSLNSVRYFYLRELPEPRDNSLRLLVDEAICGSEPTDATDRLAKPALGNLVTNVHPIRTTETCRIFELIWSSYVAYLVTEECVGSCGKYDDETFEGKLFRVYQKSHFLEHLARDTGAHFKRVLHYKLVCLNHLIDVAAYDPPKIRTIERVPADPSRLQ